MELLKPSSVVDFSGDLKTAALYFDYVFPVVWSTALIEHEYNPATGFTWMLETITDALFPPGVSGYLKNAALVMANSGSEIGWRAFLELVEQRILPDTGLLSAPRLLPNPVLIEEKVRADNKDRVRYAAIGERVRRYVLPDVPLPQIKTLPEEKLEAANDDCVMITLVSLPLVDVTRASWEQIIAFRGDSKSRQRLMQLRAFAQTNYAGKSKAFVEADLFSRLEQYENTAKDWGFETLTSTLSVVLSSPHLLGAAAATWSSILLGHPALAAAAATGGTAIELGKIGLHLTQRKFEFTKLRRDHPLGYIVEARRQIEPESERKVEPVPS